MDGFTVKNADRFLSNQGVGDSQRMRISDSSKSENSPISSTDGKPGASFADTLNQAIQGVNELQKTADKQMQNLATGKTDNVADVMIATEKADIALKLMVQVRNKIIDAYQEIMKMQA